MIKKILLVSAVLIAAVGIFIALPDSKKSEPAVKASTSLTMQTVKDEVVKGGLLIDVRTATEYAESHIDGAINLSLQDMQAGTLPTVTKDKSVYVYCHSGNRSGQATTILKEAGFQNATDLGAMTHVQSIGGVIKS